MHVQDLEHDGARYGFSMIWLPARTYLKGWLMVLVRDDIQPKSQGPLPVISLLDERVLWVGLHLRSGDKITLLNVHAPNPAAHRKVSWEELMGVE